jgi:GcvH upstream region-like protein
MLTFFRKYQKAFFAVVAVFTISSFLFFGSYGAMQGGVKGEDYPIGATFNGKKISNRQMNLLTRFLATSSHERELFEKRSLPNLLNDGVLQIDFLETGFASLLAQRHFDFFKEEWDKKLERIRTYHPYQHPNAPFLSAKSIWSHFNPSIASNFEALKEKKEMDSEGFALLCSLYLDQTRFPPDVLKQVLAFHEGQYSWLQKDNSLERADLSLFGFHTLEDWLGKRFLMSISEAIFNAAAMAKSQGLSISRSEARTSLKKNLQENYTKFFNKELSALELEEWYHRLIASLYCEEEELLDVWSDVLLFRKYFHEVPSKILVDSSTLKNSAIYASEELQVDIYHFPEYLELKTFRDLLKLQLYIEAITPSNSRKQNHNVLSFPVVFAAPNEVEKRYPELVQTNYEIELQEVSLNTLVQDVSLKEAYAWENDESHWLELTKNFPVLRENLPGLEALTPSERAAVDFYAKKRIVQSKPNWLIEALTKAQKKQVSLGFRQEGGSLPLRGDVDREELKQKLDACGVNNSFVFNAGDYSYQITLLSAPKATQILTFVKANSDGTLDLILDRTLTQAYPEIRKKRQALFAKKEGGFKPLKEVEDQVGAELYANLLQKIEDETKKFGISWPENKSLDQFAKYRLIVPMQEARNALAKGTKEEVIDQLAAQWNLVKEEKQMTRIQAQEEKLERLFDQKENAWSSVHVKKFGAPYFYRILGKRVKDGDALSLAEKTKELLELDAERMLFSELLDKMSSHDLIAFSQNTE